MRALTVQIQLLLAVTGALLPLAADGTRVRLAALFDLLAAVLARDAAAPADDLADRLARIRAGLEGLAAGDARLTADRLDEIDVLVTAAARALRTDEGA